jgi:hypothetical protein
MHLSEVLPEFSSELENGLNAEGRHDLAKQIGKLELLDRCRCGDEFCATFHTLPKQDRTEHASRVERLIPPVRGLTEILVVDGRLASFEVLFRPDIRQRLLDVLP